MVCANPVNTSREGMTGAIYNNKISHYRLHALLAATANFVDGFETGAGGSRRRYAPLHHERFWI